MKAFATIFAAMIASSSAANAQAWPSKPIQIIVPFAAGGAVDIAGRIFAPQLQEQLKQPVIVVNKPGAGGNIGTDFAAKSAPDGHTILLTTNGQSISPSIFKQLNWSPDDFAPVTQLFSTFIVIVTGPKSRLQNLQDLIAAAKARPGALNYGGSGVGNAFHLTMERLKFEAGFDMQMVPYKSDGEIINALATGEIEVAMLPHATAKPLIEHGELRAIAATAPKRSPALPNVPTIAEQGMPDFWAIGYQALFAPAKTPRDVVDRLWREARTAMQAPMVKARLDAFSVTPLGSSPEEFATFYKEDVERFRRIVRDARIPLQD